MSEERKVFRVTMSCETDIWVLAKDAAEARGIGREAAHDLIDPWNADIDARPETAPLGGVLHNDDRTVAQFMAGKPSDAQVEAAEHAAWMAERPVTGTPVEWASWVVRQPIGVDNVDGVWADGEFAWCGWAALRVDGAALACQPFRSSTVASVRKVFPADPSALPLVTLGDVVKAEGRYMSEPLTVRWCGPAAVQESLAAQWLPGQPTEVRASGPMDAVYFTGPGWEAVLMPTQTKQARL